jgi:FtsH-binding integral membrane protein
LIVLFLAFCVVESFYIAFIFASYAQNYNKLLLVFGIPAFTFVIMGLLGYFQIFNFGKI